MRKTIATVIILGLIWIGYIAWPLYNLLVLVRAMETRDIDTVTRGVYFDAVRASLTSQVVAAYGRRTRINIGRLGQSVAARALGIADPIVQKLISPEALSELLRVGWPATVVSDLPPDTVGITSGTIGTIWQIFENSEYGLGRFEVTAPSVLRFGYCGGADAWSRSFFQKPRPWEAHYESSGALLQLARLPWRRLPKSWRRE